MNPNYVSGIFDSTAGAYNLKVSGGTSYPSSGISLGKTITNGRAAQLLFANDGNLYMDANMTSSNAMNFRYTQNGTGFSNMLTLTQDDMKTDVYASTVNGRVKSSQYVVDASFSDARVGANRGLYIGQNSSGSYFSMNNAGNEGSFKFATTNANGTSNTTNLVMSTNGNIQMPFYNKTTNPDDIESSAVAGFEENGNLVRNYSINKRLRVSETALNTISGNTLGPLVDKVNTIISRINGFKFNGNNITLIGNSTSTPNATPTPTATPIPGNIGYKYAVDFTPNLDVYQITVVVPAVTLTYGGGQSTVYSARTSSNYDILPGYTLVSNWSFESNTTKSVTTGVVFSNDNKTVTGNPTQESYADDGNIISINQSYNYSTGGKYVYSMDWTWGGVEDYDLVGIMFSETMPTGQWTVYLGNSGQPLVSVGITDTGKSLGDNAKNHLVKDYGVGASGNGAITPIQTRTLDLYIDIDNRTMFRLLDGKWDPNTSVQFYTSPSVDNGIDISNLLKPCFFIKVISAQTVSINLDNAPPGFNAITPETTDGSNYNNSAQMISIYPMKIYTGSVYMSFTLSSESYQEVWCGIYDAFGNQSVQASNRYYVTKNGGCKDESDNVYVTDLGTNQSSKRIDLAIDTIENVFWYRIDGGSWSTSL
jgi:hypothetical protein